MKKVTTTLITVMLWAFASVSFAQLSTQPQWNRVLSDSPESFRKQLVSSSERSTVVNLQVPGFYTLSVTTPRGEAKLVTMPKALSTAKAGEPDLPMTGIPVLIGDQARMGIRVLDAQYMDFEGIEVAPSKGDFSRQIDPATVPYTYGECYSQDAFFPASNVGLYEPYIVRDFRGQNMVLYPYAYNPVTRTLRVYYDMTVEMYKLDDNGANAFETRRSNTVKMSQDFKSLYQRHFINYEAAMNRYTPLDEEGDLLIICYDNFISSMTDFVNWKKTRGINTTIVGTSTAGSSYSAIQTYIKNQYNANNNLTHVLLVGDVAQIPGYSYTGGGSSYAGLGDNAYGQVVGNDIYNDVFIGRFSAGNASQVTTQVNRIITYERELTTSATWCQVGLGISTTEGSGGHNDEDDYEHIENLRTDLLNYGYTTVYQDYKNVSGFPSSTTTTISNHINSGVGIINYCNHGEETGWQSHYYMNSNVNALTNNNKLPFIFSVACLVGKYDYSSGDCFGETWMHATNSNTPTGAIGGAFSYISQPWIPPMWAQDEFVDILVESYNNNIKHTLGGTMVNGMMAIFDNYSTSTAQAVGTYQAWIVYGDPSLMLRTKTPQAMTVNHAGTITSVGGAYAVNVTNGNGAVATITDANHNILGKATVSNGTATVNVNGTLTPNDELTLCVFGYNKVTYLGTIQVVGGTQYTISTQVSPANSGTVSGGGTYYGDTQCTLTATANNHYEFSRWTKNGAQVSTSNPYTFTVTGDATYVANFTAMTAHTVTCSTVQNGSVSASPTTAYKGETVTLTATPAAGYCLGTWIVTAGNQTITVTNNQFTMPDSNVTVSATFVPGYTVTLAPATNGSISASPMNGPAGTSVSLTTTPATGYVFDSWVVYKTGDATTTVNVSGNTFTLPAYDVTVVGIFSQPQGGDVTIGSGSNTNAYLPTYAYYNYSLTQQIYTASEVGSAGTITKVAFKVSNSKSTTRTIDVYLKHTSKSTFTSNTGWETLSTSYHVYSGSVTFNASGWTTITLSTPFEYNGTSNLLLCVDDNTNSYVSSSSNSPQFYVYSTSENRALRYYNDYTNPDPASPSSVSGSYVTSNNQIVFTKEVPSTDGYLSVTPTSLSGFSAVAGISASNPQSVAVIGANLQANLTVTAPTGYEVSTTSGGTYNSTLTLTPSNGNINANVFVRLSSSVNPGNYSGNMTLASGTATATVSLNGTVSPGNVPQYTISVTAATGGTVTGGGIYYQGSTCTLTATPNEHYTFAGWQLNGSIVSTDNPYNITVTGDANYTALFNVMPQYNVTVNQVEGGTIIATPTTLYPGETVTLTVSANTGYFFVEWVVKDANNQSVNVNDNQFTMPESDVTVTAVFTQGFSVTLEQTAHGTISADKTTALQPSETVTLTATPDNGCVFLAWYVYKTGSPRDVISVVNDEWFFMPSSDVTAQAIFVTEEEHEQTVGGNGTATSTYIPTRTNRSYSLSQQIYTAAEIGYNGRITAIAFKANTSVSRTLEVYLAHTDKTVFSSTTDWEMMGSVAKVFSGGVTFVNGWTTITFNTPFEYDGISNLNVCVIDKTGSSGTSATFSMYNTSSNRALYINSNNTDYSTKIGYTSINTSTYAGTRSTSNNQIKFTIKVPGSAESLTVSPGEMDNFSYEEGQGPSATNKFGIVGVDLSNDIMVTAPTNFEISLTENGTYASSIVIPRETSKRNRDIQSWGFEGTLDGWTALDSDGDGYNWVLSSASVGVYLGSSETAPGGHDSSTDMMVSGSYTNAGSVALTPDNWLISPQVSLGGSFSLWACPQRARYPAEHFGIYVSTTNTSTSSFILLNEWTISNTTWAQYSVDLTAFAGQTGYIAVRHFNCTDQFAIGVDDFVLDTDAAITIEMPVTITPATVYVRLKDNLGAGDYSGTLTANAGEITGNVSLSGQVTLPSQSVTLTQGWNWWTPMLEAPVDDLQTALADYNATILLPESGAPNVVPGKLYKIQVAQDCEVLLSGHKPASVTVTFDNGLSGFGFTGTQETTIGEALNGLNPVEGDMVNSFDEGFAIFNGTAWEGTLTTLKPGQGYEYLSKSQDAKSVTF